MLRASFYKELFKGLAFCLALLPALSCTQEYLILANNLDKSRLVSMEDVLRESGLVSRPMDVRKQRSVVETPETRNYDVADAVPITNIRYFMTNSADQEFSVNLSSAQEFIVLRSVQGGLKLVKKSSDGSNVHFDFRTGGESGRIEFQTYANDGRIDRSIVYNVHVFPRQVVHSEPTNTKKKKDQTNEQTNANAPDPNLSQMILSSVQGLSPTEASRELQKMLASEETSDNDKEYIRYRLLDIMIAQRNYASAEEQIKLVRSEPMKTLYRARYLKAKGSQKEALRSYIALLAGGEETKKTAILELEELVLDIGSVDKSLVESLKAETGKFKNDKDFYGTSMIQIAKIYPFLQDVYSARDILEKIRSGDFSDEIKNKAEKAYQELKKDFLEYR